MYVYISVCIYTYSQTYINVYTFISCVCGTLNPAHYLPFLMHTSSFNLVLLHYMHIIASLIVMKLILIIFKIRTYFVKLCTQCTYSFVNAPHKYPTFLSLTLPKPLQFDILQWRAGTAIGMSFYHIQLWSPASICLSILWLKTHILWNLPS